MTELRAAHKEILLHSLGLDEQHETPWRNFYSTDADDPTLLAMVKDGLMRGPVEKFGGHMFFVTEEGIHVASEVRPRPPKLNRGERRYRAFLNHDSGLTFGEWLKHYGREAGR